MPDYGRGAVLGAATSLPVTAATSLLFLNNANIFVVASFLAVSAISLLLTVSMVVRFAINSKRYV